MKCPSVSAITFSHAVRKVVLAAALTGSLAVVDNVHAQAAAPVGVLVADTGNQTINSAMAAFQTGAQYTALMDQLFQLKSSIQGLTTGLSLLPNTMQHADPNTLTQLNCASDSSSSLISSVMSSLTTLINPNQPIAQTQQQICVQIITAQVTKYNLVVDRINQIQTYSTMADKVEDVAKQISSLGDSSRANNQAAIYNNALATSQVDFESNIKAQDAIINTLEQQQSQLSKAAFGAHPDLLGEATQAAVLTAVFSIDN